MSLNIFKKAKDSWESRSLSAIALLSLGFLSMILIGALLLTLPFASAEGKSTNFLDCLFVSTSASCVTGLVPFDTGLHWSMFGQVVILVLIQIGGLGFMTLITFVAMLFRRNISLYSRTIVMQSAGTYSIGGVVPLMRRIIIGTLFFETAGALGIIALLWDKMGKKAIWYGIFHSVSAFCNAGFDILGPEGSSSISIWASDWRILLILSALILIGGAGFLVWSDLWQSRFRWKRLHFHSKIVLTFSLVLVVVPTVLFFFSEFQPWNDAGPYASLSLKDKIFNSFFMAVSPRTAGFSTVDLSELSVPGRTMTTVLMFIGGNSGSTAGGVKLTTVIVVLANLIANARGKNQAVLFGESIPTRIIRQASALFNAYLVLIVISTTVISFAEPFPLDQILFETTSAIATVGLSLGITGTLGWLSKVVIIFLMFFGRLGAFALFDLLFRNKSNSIIKYPEGRLLVG
ncbi:MAG: Trk family potassium uptake protein [Clostridia bacterium]|nr:Trk family potassium uptake protein [Clostridia bacterium]